MFKALGWLYILLAVSLTIMGGIFIHEKIKNDASIASDTRRIAENIEVLLNRNQRTYSNKCLYIPGRCYAPRGIGPWQEVNCEDASPNECGSSCMKANKDACSANWR